MSRWLLDPQLQGSYYGFTLLFYFITPPYQGTIHDRWHIIIISRIFGVLVRRTDDRMRKKQKLKPMTSSLIFTQHWKSRLLANESFMVFAGPSFLKALYWAFFLAASSKDLKGEGSVTNMDETFTRLTEKLRPRLLESTSASTSPHWIGVAGGPGTGKSTVAKTVCDRLNQISPDSAIVIPMDGWHIPQDRLTEEYGLEEGMQRRGASWTFDSELLYEDLTSAKNNAKASLPMYSRDISDPVPDKVLLEPHHKIVFVEGIYMLWKDDKNNEWGRLFDLWDEKWFIECPSREDQIERLVNRSLKTWTEKKVKLWGKGRAGALMRVNFNDLKNADIIRHCSQFADEIIVTR